MSREPGKLCSLAKVWGNWSMHLKITAVSFFYRFLKETVKIPEYGLTKFPQFLYRWHHHHEIYLIKMCKIRFCSYLYFTSYLRKSRRGQNLLPLPPPPPPPPPDLFGVKVQNTAMLRGKSIKQFSHWWNKKFRVYKAKDTNLRTSKKRRSV